MFQNYSNIYFEIQGRVIWAPSIKILEYTNIYVNFVY